VLNNESKCPPSSEMKLSIKERSQTCDSTVVTVADGQSVGNNAIISQQCRSTIPKGGIFLSQLTRSLGKTKAFFPVDRVLNFYRFFLSILTKACIVRGPYWLASLTHTPTHFPRFFLKKSLVIKLSKVGWGNEILWKPIRLTCEINISIFCVQCYRLLNSGVKINWLTFTAFFGGAWCTGPFVIFGWNKGNTLTLRFLERR